MFNIGMISLILFAKAFIIEERITGKYFNTSTIGKVVLVSNIEDASRYEIRKVGDSPIEMAIYDKESKFSFDYNGGGETLIAYPYHGRSNQLFRINLDEDGYWQLLQGNNKFMYYDESSQRIKGGIFVDARGAGFLIYNDSMTGCWPSMMGAKSMVSTPPLPPVHENDLLNPFINPFINPLIKPFIRASSRANMLR